MWEPKSLQSRDLRIRFGLYLALALLPLLIFSLFASLDDFKRELQYRDTEITRTANQAAFSIVDTLDTGKAILKTAAQTISDADCEGDLRQVLDGFPAFDYFVVLNSDGRAICSANAALNRAVLPDVATYISKDSPFHTNTTPFEVGDAKRLRAVFITYGDYFSEGANAGTLRRVMMLGFDPERVKNDAAMSDASKDQNLFIINERGEELVSTGSALPANRSDWVDKAKKNGPYYDSFTDTQGNIRDVFITTSRDEDFFLALSYPKTTILRWSLLNPLSSIFIPLLAWLFGFIAIWFSADKLILSHLRKLRRATIGFAKGDNTRRVGELKNSPQSIYALGQNFDLMADRISEREDALKDSLVEKETLLREIHHRVKNNLQIIISLLNMQERKLRDPAALSAINDTRSRINAISLVHRGLYESEDLRYVNMQTFLDRLIPELSLALGTNDIGIRVTAQADCDVLEADTATPLALFIVEALTNSVKHGVNQGGEVLILIAQTGTELNVLVQDTPDIPPEIRAVNETTGMGMKLIRGFARQLGGTMEREASPQGYRVSLTFSPRELSEAEVARRNLM